jgi:Secretion system C-terminal sorting domain
MKKTFLLSMICWLITLPDLLSAQSTVFHPTFVRKAVYADVTPPLRDMKLIQIKKVKNGLEKEIPNKIGMKEFNNRVTHPFLLQEDPVWQKQDGTYLPANSGPTQNFEGIGNLSGLYPPDTQGDVGPDKYIQVVNSNFAIYSKTGTVLMGPAALSTIFAGIPSPWNGTNNGDPVVLYDQATDRWMISQFSLPTGNFAELVAVSQTSDPTGAWYRYVFQFGSKMPDYPKFGIWPDGYYLSFNQFLSSVWGGVGACALERTKMLTGDPNARMVYFDLGATSDPTSMLPADWDGITPPIAGEPNYFSYFNDWSSTTEDYLKIWQFHVDWTTTTNSTFSEAYSLVTAAFNSQLCTAVRGRCIPQPGTSIKLESLSDRLMYRLQYRNFGNYRSMVTNHTVNIDGNGRAGIRWYELRNTEGAWTIYQQGTYSPDASERWMGSVAMNANGDIALGYSLSNSTTIYPSIRYTGRRATDSLGQMTMAEQTIIDGTGNQTGTACRWGDYSGMSVDASDDQTFWFTTEYIQTSGNAIWKTRIASFKINNSPAATTLTASNISPVSATLNGTVQAANLTTTVTFEYGTTQSYGSTVNAIPATVTGNIPTNVSANITGLTPLTTYHFRVTAINAEGTAYGNDMSFTTASTIACTDAFEPNNTISTAKQIQPGNPITALINPSGDIDWFKFSNTGSKKNVKVELYNLPADYDLQLCDSKGTVLMSSQNRGNMAETINYNTNKVTSFTIRVNGYNGAWSQYTCYTLNVTLSNTPFTKDEEILQVSMLERGPGLIIYPNPVSGKVNIDYSSKISGKVNLNVYNITGQLLITTVLEAIEGDNTFQVDVSSLNKGIYFLELIVNGERLFGKVMVE